MKNKIRILFLLSIASTIGILIFQISWLKSSYQVSKDKTKIEINQLFDQAILKHKELVADTVRDLLKQGLLSAADYDFSIIEYFEKDRAIIGYRCKGKTTTGWLSYNVSVTQAKEIERDPQAFLLQKISTSDINKLEVIYSTLIGVGDYPVGSEKDKIQENLMLSFYYSKDVNTLNWILKQLGTENKLGFDLKATYYPDIEEFYKKKALEAIPNLKDSVTSYKVIEVRISKTKKSLTSRLDSLNAHIQKLNNESNLIYVAKPLNGDALTFTIGQVPLLLLTAKVPSSYLLQQMLLNIIASKILLLLLAFSLTYMLRTILKQKKLSDIKDDFISNVSHELKTPVATTLAAIQGMQHFDVLKDRVKTDQYLNTAANEMKRLSQMIDTILNSAIYENSSFNLQPVKFNFKEMLVDMINVQQLHSKKEVHIKLDYNADAEIFADQTHLRNVFLNLIDNAVKYGKEKVMISISCVKTDVGIKIQISDNGIGIPNNYQKNIFDKFFRVPTPNDHSIKGYGLGLSYVKNIVEKHNGTIVLINSNANGSSFEINLPQ
jgi:signal transduction histidine kinase